MTDPIIVITAIVTGAVTVIAAIGSMIVLIINTKASAKAAAATLAKTHDIEIATTKIHELTNSTNSNLQKSLELEAAKVKAMEGIIAELREAKKDTAAAQVVTDQKVSAALRAETPPAD